MGRRSKLRTLPTEVRERLEAEMDRLGYSGYRELADWMKSLGHETSESALQRYGKEVQSRVEHRLQQVRLASAVANAMGRAVEDDGEAIAISTQIQAQTIFHDIIFAAEEGDTKAVIQATRALAELQRAGISLRRERKLGRQEALKDATEAVDRAAEDLGQSPNMTPAEIVAVFRQALSEA